MSDVRPGRAAPSFRLGDCGAGVAAIRGLLTSLDLLGPDGESATDRTGDPDGASVFDAPLDRAVRAFQQHRGLTVDGVVGTITYRALDEARWALGDRLLTHVPGSVICGDDVLALQQRLLDLGFKVGRVDGRFGHRTELAVREFQRNVGVPPDGTCGPATLKALSRLAPRTRGGRPNAMRAEERLRRAGPQLAGKVVVIDPAVDGITDPFLRGQAAAVTDDLGRRVEGRLAATGVQALLTHGPAAAPLPEAERADFANRTGADLCISLQLDANPSPQAGGVSTYFYGNDAHGVVSSAGERFAGLVQREIVARTGLTDLRSHAKTWDLLRLTRMPAVRIDVGYLSSPSDAVRLADPAFRDVVAEAVVIAVQRMYLSPEADAKTGVLRLSELRAAVRAQQPPR